ncbi:hypothetical protein FPQ18DRAFT_301966 [Pyronema domesticum]|nr:hypothetical protein FPQ18DRAFT_301966 [Pyronema domesticum]
MVAATNWSAKPATQALFFLTTTGFPPVDRCCEQPEQPQKAVRFFLFVVVEACDAHPHSAKAAVCDAVCYAYPGSLRPIPSPTLRYSGGQRKDEKRGSFDNQQSSREFRYV